MAVTIDSHQHFWQLGQFDYRWLDAPANAPIRRNFLPNDLEPLLKESGVQACIVVQTQHDVAENDWALKLAESHPFIAGVVGWVDLAEEDCEALLRKYAEHPKFVGIRHVVQDEPDHDFVVRPEILRGLRTLASVGLPYDFLCYVKQLKHAKALAKEVPELKLVIDHLGKPLIKEHRMEGWLDELRAAAKFPNVYCKLSGLVTEADWKHWTVDQLRPYVHYALEAFGPDRCMYGSDWPVCTLAGSYSQVHSALRECVMGCSAAEQAKIFGETAKHFYRLQEA